MVAQDSVRSFRYSLDIKALILLNKLEVQHVALWKTVNSLIASPLRLIGKIRRLDKGDSLSSFDDTVVEAIEIVAVSPFANKMFWVFQVMHVNSELLISLRWTSRTF